MTKRELRNRRARGRTRRLNALGLSRRGAPLINRHWRALDRLGLHGKAREAERRKLVRAEHKAVGLTVRGTVRKQRVWTGLRGATRRERWRVWHADWIKRNRYDKGLTARGTVRRGTATPQEIAWRDFRSTIKVELPEFQFTAGRAE